MFEFFAQLAGIVAMVGFILVAGMVFSSVLWFLLTLFVKVRVSRVKSRLSKIGFALYTVISR